MRAHNEHLAANARLARIDGLRAATKRAEGAIHGVETGGDGADLGRRSRIADIDIEASRLERSLPGLEEDIRFYFQARDTTLIVGLLISAFSKIHWPGAMTA